MGPVTIEGDAFVQDGRTLQIIAGAIHYFRVVPEYWEDRLRKAVACGLNAVETYVAWNLHEPRPGEFDFSGGLDLPRFLEMAGDMGLMAIVRPGPYICSEWELGGLPPWLLADPDMRLRCAYSPYLERCDAYLDAVMARVAPLQAHRGGPVVAMQVENEYGSYSNDKVYLAHLRDGLRSRGFEGLLFTSDGPTDGMLEGGTLPDVHKVVNFGADARGAFAKLREWQPTGPLMCGEFWNGWFDHWGEEHHRRDAADAAQVLDEMLSMGASVCCYMFHGGTNFGFMNGANCDTAYEPTVSSYDDDAPIAEGGDLTPKWHAFREVIGKHRPLPEVAPPPPLPRRAYGPVAMGERVSIFTALDGLAVPTRAAALVTMEALGQNYGFILYRTGLNGPREGMLAIPGVRDRALVCVDDRCEGVVYRNDPQPGMNLTLDPGAHRLDLLVENMGRVNYGPQIHDRKGIIGEVLLDGEVLADWVVYQLPLDDLSSLIFTPAQGAPTGPAFYRGTFEVDDPADTFLALPGWTKGICFLNGINLGRYWEIGPQRTLYIPAPLLRQGANELIVLELHGATEPTVELRTEPDLG